MADLLPSDPDIDPPEGDPRVLGVDSEDADAVLGALSSETSRAVLTALHDDPSTPSELADAVDTSLQNTQYHLGKLEDADLIEVCGTRYSEKGREMNVYAPTDGPLVLFAGTEERTEGMKSALARLLGAVGVLAVASVLVQRLLDSFVTTGGAGGAGGGAPATTTSGGMGAMDVGTTTAVPTTAASGGGGGLLGGGVPPGLAFFLGGVFAVALVGGWWAIRR
ncbi:MAG: ArsR/SmtB family transcription factor [Halobacteriaceae archaeon]